MRFEDIDIDEDVPLHRGDAEAALHRIFNVLTAAFDQALKASPFAEHYNGGQLRRKEDGAWQSFCCKPSIGYSEDFAVKLCGPLANGQEVSLEALYNEAVHNAKSLLTDLWTDHGERIILARALVAAAMTTKLDLDAGIRQAERAISQAKQALGIGVDR